jgi:pimeloyl-ACP methyl ester carboxylesterase
VNDTSLGFAATGTGAPLLLVAGYGADQSGWRRQVDGLAPAYTVVTYDHRGVGASWPIGEAGTSIAELAADARALLAHLNLAPAVVVGASMGAAVALELALAHPETVRGLVLVTPVLERDAPEPCRERCETDAPAGEARIRGMLPGSQRGLAHVGLARRRQALRAMARASRPRPPPHDAAPGSVAPRIWISRSGVGGGSPRPGRGGVAPAGASRSSTVPATRSGAPD